MYRIVRATAAVVLIILSAVLLYIGVKQKLLAPLTSGVGFLTIAIVFLVRRR